MSRAAVRLLAEAFQRIFPAARVALRGQAPPGGALYVFVDKAIFPLLIIINKFYNIYFIAFL